MYVVPAELKQQSQTVRTTRWNRQMQAVAPHSPDDCRAINIPVRNLLSEQLPQNHAERPENKSASCVKNTCTCSSSKRVVSTHQTSTFSEHGSFRMTSGAIQATVPANDILVLFSFHWRLVPKSLIFTTSFAEMRTLQHKSARQASNGVRRHSTD